jgi:hypothetical protein
MILAKLTLKIDDIKSRLAAIRPIDPYIVRHGDTPSSPQSNHSPIASKT